jgi:predicted amidophosphoribosyltransferase
MYGIDQTSVLADAVSDIVRLPVMRDLAAGLWTPRSAGRQRSTRVAPAFRSLRPVAGCPVLIDDVCTTGKTLAGAALALGYERIPALVATAAGSMEGEVDDSGTRRWRDQNTGVR